MSTDPVTRDYPPPVPATTAHRLIGTLNILFASVMLLCGLCSGASLLMQVAMAPMTEGYQKQMQETIQAQIEKEHQKKIDELKDQENAAATAEEKARLVAEREALEQKTPAEVPIADMMAAYRDPKLIGYLIADMTTGLFGNVFMLASGIGLLASKAWARRLGVWVAVFKIIRLVAVYGFAIVFVIPVFSQKMGEMLGQMTEQMQQKAAPPAGGAPIPNMAQTMATFYGIAMSSGAVLMILFGAIYPAIVLWVLTRPRVKSACGEVPVGFGAELQ
ncbi:MAG TPA: hypothetical protein VGN12_06295 [Pirellulales bacterium]|jgi:hypothetical protein